jgi:prophage antirepressor-like protein
MIAEIIPFDFEEQAVRVMMRDGEPWFVAADVCRVLELSNPTMAVKALDEDEVTLSEIEGSHRPTNLVSESGLYALVIRSDKPAAKRFRKWITAEVLPTIRRTGSYELTPPPPEAGPMRFGTTMSERDWLAFIREARLLGGVKAGRRMWAMSPFPPLHTGTHRLAAVDLTAATDCLACLRDRAPAPLVPETAQDREAQAALAQAGLRIVPGGVFIANTLPAVFAGTQWAAGLHRPLLLALPGVLVDDAVRTVANVPTRGIIVPWSLIGAEV